MTDSGAVGSVRTRERSTVRTARYVVLGAEPAQARRIWFVLHGYGMLAHRFVRPFEHIIPPETCIVAPEALSRFYLEMPRADGGHMQRIGATWLTKESRDTEIADAHQWLDAVHDEVMNEAITVQGHAPVTAVLGFSQGVATAMRWVASGSVAPRLFVAWAGGLAQDVDRAAFVRKLENAELLLVSGTRDQYATDANRTAMASAIAALGVKHRILSFDGEHNLHEPLLAEILAELPAQ